MARARGYILPAVLTGTITCGAVVERVAVAQEAAEVMEDLGHSYRLARWTTAQGSIIETLLFAGQTIVTDIAIPAQGAGKIISTSGAGTSAATPGSPAVKANASQSDAAALPSGLGSGFIGTWLTGEIIDGYLVLHRIRADDPVTHDIFSEGQKVGSIAEVGPPVRAGRPAGRNSFTFERTQDRFVVHLRQLDGTTIHATTEQGRFLNQVVERSASLAVPPRTGAGAPIAPARQPEAVRVSPSPEPPRLALPQEAAGAVAMREPAPPALTQPETIPLPRPNPLPRPRPAVSAGAAPPAGPKPAMASVATERPSASPKQDVRAREAAPRVARPKAALETENAQRPLRNAEKPDTPVVTPLPPPWDKWPQPWGVNAGQPAAPAARPSPPSPWDASVRYWQYGR